MATIETTFNDKTQELVILVAGVGEIRVAVDTLAQEIRQTAIVHGLKQKIVDAAALSRDPETGRSASPEQKFQAMKEVADRITDPVAPSWNARAGEGSGGEGGLLVRALMRMSGKDRETVVREVQNWDKKQQAAVRALPDVAAVIAKIKEEDGAKVAPKDAAAVQGLLASLMG